MIIKIRPKKIVTVLILIPLFIIACFSYNIADYGQYFVAYERVNNNNFTGYQMEIGYIFLERMGALLHLDFVTFRAIYIAIALILLINSVKAYTNENPLAVLTLYFIYPFFLDIVQIRHLMAISIVIFCLRFLEQWSFKNMLFYIIGIFIATTQHSIAILYLLLLLVYIDLEITKFFKYVVIAIGIEVFVASRLYSEGIINRLYLLICERLLKIRNAGAFMLARTDAVNKYYILMTAILAFLLWILWDRSHNSYKQINIETNGKFDFLYRISLLSLCFIPLININDHLARANRGLMIIIYIVFTIYARKKQTTSVRKWVYKAFPLAVSVICFYMFLSSRSQQHYETVTQPLFQNNYFIEWLFKQ